VAEAGTLMYMEVGIKMETVFGDGSQPGRGSGFFDKLMGAGKRLLTGESLFTTVVHPRGSGKKGAAFAAPYPGTIIPMNLSNFGGTDLCQKDSVPLRGQGRLGRHRLPEEDPHRPVRRRGLHHAAPPGRWPGLFVHAGGTCTSAS
jgi:hypothetical protein